MKDEMRNEIEALFGYRPKSDEKWCIYKGDKLVVVFPGGWPRIYDKSGNGIAVEDCTHYG